MSALLKAGGAIAGAAGALLLVLGTAPVGIASAHLGIAAATTPAVDLRSLPARWLLDDVPVTLCTSSLGRPRAVSADEFRAATISAARAWNEAAALPLFSYAGECASDSEATLGNGRNEIRWDGEALAASPQADGVTRQLLHGTVDGAFARLVEVDVVLSGRVLDDRSLAAYQRRGFLYGLIVHELGHALGLEHSAAEEDAMRPTLRGDVTVSARDASRVRAIYGNPARLVLTER